MKVQNSKSTVMEAFAHFDNFLCLQQLLESFVISMPLYFRRFFPSSYGRPTRPPVLPLFSEFFAHIFCPRLDPPFTLALWLRVSKQGLRLIPNAKPQKITPSLLFLSPLNLSSIIRSWSSIRQTDCSQSGSHCFVSTITCH